MTTSWLKRSVLSTSRFALMTPKPQFKKEGLELLVLEMYPNRQYFNVRKVKYY